MTLRTQTLVPNDATDCHHHIYDARWPAAAGAKLTPPNATPQEYEHLKVCLGVTRHVVVQPSTYGFDNGLLLQSLRYFGSTARGVAAVAPGIADADLKLLHRAGVRGARVNLVVPGAGTVGMVQSLASRVRRLGWHIELAATGAQLLENRHILQQLDVPIVVCHMGLLPLPEPMKHPAFDLLCELSQTRQAWVKLSGVCNLSRSGPPEYEDYAVVAHALVAAVPGALLWGSDWPHVLGNFAALPDDERLFQLLQRWAGNPRILKQILVENPTTVYEF